MTKNTAEREKANLVTKRSNKGQIPSPRVEVQRRRTFECKHGRCRNSEQVKKNGYETAARVASAISVNYKVQLSAQPGSMSMANEGE